MTVVSFRASGGAFVHQIDLWPFLRNLRLMTAVEERRLKGLLKTAITEVLEERQDLLQDAVRESFEDVALIRAIQLGEKSPLTSRKRIFQRLGRAV